MKKERSLMMAQEQVSVLIVGAGGAGLSLSLLLRQQGIRSLLIKRRCDVSWYPRARTLNFRTMEVFRGLGLDAQVRAAGAPISRMFRKQTLAASSQEELLNPATLVEHLEEISPELLGWYCPQSRLEPLLRAVANQQGVDVRYGTELVSFTQDEAGVTAIVRERAAGKTRQVHADYLIAADGTHSRIREALGIPTQGLGELPESQMFVYFRADWGELIQGYEADAILTNNESGRGMFLITDQDRGMFAITYSPTRGESAQDYPFKRCKELIRAPYSAWPNGSRKGESSWSVTQRIRCRPTWGWASTPLSRARRTWPGNWPQSSRDRPRRSYSQPTRSNGIPLVHWSPSSR